MLIIVERLTWSHDGGLTTKIEIDNQYFWDCENKWIITDAVKVNILNINTWQKLNNAIIGFYK